MKNINPAEPRSPERKTARPFYLLIAVAFAAIMLFSPFREVVRSTLFVGASQTGLYYYGDVDYNGKVEPSDARTVLRATVRLVTLSGQEECWVYPVESGKPNQAQVADADNDLKLTSADARIILRMAVGLDELKEVDNYGKVEEHNPYDDDLSYAPTAAPYNPDPFVCKYCGKRCGVIYMTTDEEYADWPYVCWEMYGGCSICIEDCECIYCGEFVPKMTCHTCKTLKPKYQKLIESEEFKEKVEEFIRTGKTVPNDDLTTTEEEYVVDYDVLIGTLPDWTLGPDEPISIDFSSL